MRKYWYKNDWFSLGVILLVAAALRLWLVAGHVSFNYDQARDALTAQQILAGDLKIMGPSASGTNDSVYHGVLFYYVIAVLYGLTAGNPQAVASCLALISTLGLIPFFFFAKNFFHSSKLALLTTALVAVSAQAISYSGWISEHMLATLFLPGYFYYCERLNRRYSLKFFLAATLFLGLLEQAAVFNFYWGLPLVLILFKLWQRRQVTFKKLLPHLLLAGVVFSGVISTMIVTELLMWRRGILTFTTLQSSAGETSHYWQNWALAKTIINRRLHLIITPGTGANPLVPWLILGLSSISLMVGGRRLRFNRSLPLFLLAAPFALLAARPNTASQIWVGFESVILLLIVAGAYIFYRRWLTTHSHLIKAVLTGGVFAFAGLNFTALQVEKYTQHDFWRLPVQVGFDLKDQLALIDQTYTLAAGKIFSFDSLTDPYNINPVWTYLYHWYGQKHYGYTPVFTGAPQAGRVNENILSEDLNALASDSAHFVIIEPESTVNDFILGEFFARQEPFGQLIAKQAFGTLELWHYQTSASDSAQVVAVSTK
jgi:hypothetical protein